MLIAIIGPDGCGKTTIANELIINLKKEGINAEHSAMHFQILPKLKDLINPFLKNKIDSSHKEGEYYAGMKNKPNSKFKGSIYVIWYALDYFFGHFKIARIAKKRKVIIFARYYYDYYFQRGHSNTPQLIIKFFENFIPKPDLIITISRPAEEIFNLKPELSVPEIKRQQNIIKLLLTNRKNSYIIDGTKGIKDSVFQIYSLIKTHAEAQDLL